MIYFKKQGDFWKGSWKKMAMLQKIKIYHNIILQDQESSLEAHRIILSITINIVVNPMFHKYVKDIYG